MCPGKGYCSSYFSNDCYNWKNKNKPGCWVVFASFLADISNNSDQIPPDLIVIKLDAYGLHIDVLSLVWNYLPNKKEWKLMACIVLGRRYFMVSFSVRVSVLGPLFIKKHLCDLFYFLKDLNVASYWNNTNIVRLNEHKAQDAASSLLFEWIINNSLQPLVEKAIFY